MAKFYIVWNESRTEGFITDELKDAEQCRDGAHSGVYSTVGREFFGAYEDQTLTIQEVDL